MAEMAHCPLLDCGGQLGGWWWDRGSRGLSQSEQPPQERVEQVRSEVTGRRYPGGPTTRPMPSVAEMAETPSDSDNDNIDKRHKAG